MVINKIDLLPYVDFDMAKAKKDALALNRKLKIFEVSCKTSAGLKDWYNWLSDRIESFQSK
jgi:hydrogenase nickel incorporation protein HypB